MSEYQLMGFFTQNTMKVLYVLEAIEADYDFVYVDLFKAEHKQDSFRALNPVAKAPVLVHGEESLFESGAICRYVAAVAKHPLYPESALNRAKVDQWMDFFSCHLGRWLSTLYYENVIKSRANLGPANEQLVAEANRFANKQLKVIDTHLQDTGYFVGESLSVADLFAFAYFSKKQNARLIRREAFVI